MKKLMIAAAIVCAAAMSQAANIKWTSSAAGYAIDPTSVSGKDNGSYSVGSSKLMTKVGTLNYVLTIYESGSDTVVDTLSGTVGFGSTGKYQITSTATKMDFSTTYDYVLSITGFQSDIRALGANVAATDGKDGTYDYTAAQIAWTAEGSLTTPKSGAYQLTDLPGSFNVTGITFTAAPEPTSGLLLLIGVGALALRRRRA